MRCVCACRAGVRQRRRLGSVRRLLACRRARHSKTFVCRAVMCPPAKWHWKVQSQQRRPAPLLAAPQALRGYVYGLDGAGNYLKDLVINDVDYFAGW